VAHCAFFVLRQRQLKPIAQCLDCQIQQELLAINSQQLYSLVGRWIRLLNLGRVVPQAQISDL